MNNELAEEESQELLIEITDDTAVCRTMNVLSGIEAERRVVGIVCFQ